MNYVINNTTYTPILVGDLNRGDYVLESKCPCCNAPIGHPHIPGCELERCPACGKQMKNCTCVVKLI